MNGAGRRTKGGNGELEVVELIRAAGWPRAHRNFGSGSAGGGDIARGPADTVWEVKRTETLRLYDGWKQAVESCGDNDTPVLTHRRSRSPWLSTVYTIELLELFALREFS